MSEQQLDNKQIAELKSRFRQNPELIEKVASRIVTALVDRDKEEWFEGEEDLRDFAATTTRSWVHGLSTIIELPDSEWPQGATPPDTFAKALNEIDEQTSS